MDDNDTLTTLTTPPSKCYVAPQETRADYFVTTKTDTENDRKANKMTVKNLIERLQQYDPEQEVWLGFNDMNRGDTKEPVCSVMDGRFLDRWRDVTAPIIYTSDYMIPQFSHNRKTETKIERKVNENE